MYKEMMDTIGLVNSVDPEVGAAMGREHRLFWGKLSGFDWLGCGGYSPAQGQRDDADRLWHRPVHLGL